MLRPHPKPPWTPEEREWGLECLAARDSPQEIAEWAGRTVMDVLTEFKLAGYVPPEGRWRRIVRDGRGKHMVGCMLRAAVQERLNAGEKMHDLAIEAGVNYTSMAEAMRKYRDDEARRLQTA